MADEERWSAERVRRFVLTHFAATAHPPSLEILERELGLTRDAVARALDAIEARGAIYRDPNTREILAAYPFSARPTQHVVHFPDGHWVYSMCAIDALGMPAMLDTNAEIESRCAHCGKEIRVLVKNRALARYSPSDARVWYMRPDNCCVAALEQCPSINFFCSPEHLAAWRSNHPAAAGDELDVPSAFECGRSVFGNVLNVEVGEDGESF